MDQLKNYVVAICLSAVGVLFLFLRRSNSKVKELEQQKAGLQIDKDLAKVKEQSDATEQSYNSSKSSYDKLKLKYPKLFGK